MKYLCASVVIAALSLSAVAVEKQAGEKKPRVEVCFVLDTTGSMGGLIAGAKAKIWTIANQVIRQKPTPEVRVALIGYRDRGDQYVTKRFDLTDDIDAVFKNLNEFAADGGGDGPESVNLALDEAVNKVTWTADRSVLKVIFLVGDAPPHMDYKDEKQYPEICREAVKKDLIVNTVQCGDMAATTPIWREIAKSSEGEFAAIGQTGDMAMIEAPQDKEIARLTAELGTTLIPVAFADGSGTVNFELASRQLGAAQKAAEGAPASVNAERSFYLWNATTRPAAGAGLYFAGGKVTTGRNELIDQLAEGRVKLAELKDEQLPPEMRKMGVEERETFVAGKAKERKAIQDQIAELSKARLAYIEAEKAKQATAAGGKKDAFDEKVSEIIGRQAEAKRK